MYFVDTETCGFHGPTVLIQYADGPDGTIHRHNIWKEPIIDTLALIETICQEGICGFNLVFDWFHLAQTYTTLDLLSERVGMQAVAQDHIDSYAECESAARNGPCIKPSTALDLMLHARKGPYQSTMDRKDIRIKRVPKVLASPLCEELSKRVQLPDIYFSRFADKKRRWVINEIKRPANEGGGLDPDFVNIELKFKASSALKNLVVDAGLVKDVLRFGDVNVSKKYRPYEQGWSPFASAFSSKEQNWRTTIKKNGKFQSVRTWPAVIKHHISHWAFDALAIQYSIDDVKYLQLLYEHFSRPESGDNDSVLACMVACCRWKGFEIDKTLVTQLRDEARAKSESAPKHAAHVFKYICQALSPAEEVVFISKGSTKKTILEELSRDLKIDCPVCKGDGCSKCDNTGAVKHPAAIRSQKCLEARQAKFDENVFSKLLTAGRFHVSLKIIGALSSRMSGTDGLNATGVNKLKKIRKAFTLATAPLELCGGDFSAFEVAIADSFYNDETLRRELLTCYVCKQPRTVEQFDDVFCPNCGVATDSCGTKGCKGGFLVYQNGSTECVGTHQQTSDGCKPRGEPENSLRKIHGLFGMELAPGKTYDEILATKGLVIDLYDMGKRGVFSQLYGGNWSTLVTRLGIEEEVAKAAEISFATRYPGVGRVKEENYNSFCSMRQPEGIGSKVYWNEPADYAESLTGFRRYFTLENRICKALFDLASKVPPEWLKLKISCVRGKGEYAREQKVGGAVMSALLAAAFGIQSHNMRAATNHKIQSTGAILTKDLQCRFWRLQPAGVNKWHVQIFQVHDEIMAPCLPELKPKLQETVKEFVKEKKSFIPLIKMDFSLNMNNWSEK